MTMQIRKNIMKESRKTKKQKCSVLQGFWNSTFSLYSNHIRFIFFLYSVHILSIFGLYSSPIAGTFLAYSDYLYISIHTWIIAIINTPNKLIPQLSARSPPISENYTAFYN